MAGTDLTILVALAAGVISFLSPCVLPLVPAYLGQLTAIAVAGSAPGARPSRWLAVRHAFAYVAGFGAVFTVLGITATFAAGPLVDYLPALRTIGGLVLIVLGLELAGLLHVPRLGLQRTWRPLDAGAAGSLATATGSTALATGPAGSGPGVGDRLGSRVVSSRGGWLASFGLGAIFAIGWSPCIGIILGGILTVAATSGTALQGGILLIAYTIGLGLPFLVLAAVFDRAPRVMAPLIRHGRTVSLIGGLLVVAIGVAMVFDWLALLPRYFNFNTQI
jgi:cytochrome c-type biogenesis protein